MNVLELHHELRAVGREMAVAERSGRAATTGILTPSRLPHHHRYLKLHSLTTSGKSATPGMWEEVSRTRWNERGCAEIGILGEEGAGGGGKSITIK